VNTTPETNTAATWLLFGAITAFLALAAWAGAALDAIATAARQERTARKAITEQELTDASWRPGLRPHLKKGAPQGVQTCARTHREGTNEEKTTLPTTTRHAMAARRWWRNGDES
jgi:hypothetical protein